ncbi:MAG: hypothetical protein NUW14_09710 [Deltaproteobacteria bacterium]|nr:hypothetical protein [Deltaproteobacteria bacterium]
MIRPAVVLAGILLAATLAGCGGSAVSGDGTTAVTVTIGGGGTEAANATASSRATPRPLGAAIPSTVTAIRFTISGAGIPDIVQTVPVTGTTIIVTLQVPSGLGRTILVEALDSGGISHFRGVTVIDATGVPLSITIGMAVDPSNPALQTWSVVANTVSTSATLNRVTQGDGIVLAGGTSGEILSSTDGVSWTSRTSNNISGEISALAFGDNTFMAMTSTGNFAAVPVTWTNRFFGATSDNVGDWTARGVIGTVDVPIAALAFGGGIFVAVGDNSASHSLDNGATWSPPDTISGMQGLSRVAYGNGRFVAVGVADDNVSVSTDGILWETGAMGLPPSELPDLLNFGNGIFLATTSTGNVYISTDGIAWQPRTPFADLTSLDTSTSSIAAGGGGFMVITSSSLYFTFDSGATWTEVIPGPTGFLMDGTFWNGAFVTVGSTGPGSVFRSGDL